MNRGTVELVNPDTGEALRYREHAALPIESLLWHDVAAGDMPDGDATVLLWIRHQQDGTDWAGGWWDGTVWRLAESGGECGADVLFWASPEGPHRE
jgi:hypothetical protein